MLLWRCGVDHGGEAMMPKVSKTPKMPMLGTITCQNGRRDEMEAVMREMVEAAR